MPRASLAPTKAAVRREQKARPALRLVKSTDDPAIEAALVRAGIAETIAMERKRGEVFVGNAPYRRLDAVALLLRDGHISRRQAQAATRYGDDYRFLYEKRRGAVAWREQFDNLRRKSDALHRARQGALRGDPDIIFICDQVCGRGMRPSRLWRAEFHAHIIGKLKHGLDGLLGYYGWERLRDE